MPARIGRLFAGVWTQASSHSSQGVVHDRINDAGCEHCNARQERSIPLLNGLGLRWVFATMAVERDAGRLGFPGL